MELDNAHPSTAAVAAGAVYTGGTPGLASPNQLVNLTACVAVTIDQTASGAPLLLVSPRVNDSHSAKLAAIRSESFQRLGDAWRTLADR